MLKASWGSARALTGLVALVGLAAAMGQPRATTPETAAQAGMARAHQESEALRARPLPLAHPEAQGLQEAHAFQAGDANPVNPAAQGLQEVQALQALFDKAPVALKNRPSWG